MEYWKSTQQVLQEDTCLVRRPRLTEPLLRKPPFRFLHDVISEVCRNTGFGAGLFSPEEQLSTNMKDKDSKVAYLWKIINCVGITLNATVPARPLKIVAGLEPEHTNVFLQMLAAATTVDSPSRQRAVSKVLSGEKLPATDQGGIEWIQRLKRLTSQRLGTSQEARSHSQYLETMASNILPEKQETASDNPTPAPEEKMTTIVDAVKDDQGFTLAPYDQSAQEVLDPQTSGELMIILQRNKRGEIPQTPTTSGTTSHEPSKSPSLSACKSNISQSQQIAEKPSVGTGGSSSYATPTNGSKKRDSHITKGGPVERSLTPAAGDESWPPVCLQSFPGFQLGIVQTQRVPQNCAGADGKACESIEKQEANQELVLQLQPMDMAISSRDDTLTSTSGPTTGQGSSGKDTGGADERGTDASDAHADMMVVFPLTAPMTGLRPQSARKGPPKIHSTVIIEKGAVKPLLTSTLEMSSSVIGGRELHGQRRPRILLDFDMQEDDEADSMPVLLPAQNNQEAIVASVEGAGKLVRDILVSKQDLQDYVVDEETDHKEKETGIILGGIPGSYVRKEDTPRRQEEVRRLREAVQSLCQATNPLGKSIDYLQEDVEVMSKEHQFWITEREAYSVRLEEEKKITEEMLQAEAGRIVDVEEEIHHQQQRIVSSKAQLTYAVSTFQTSIMGIHEWVTYWSWYILVHRPNTSHVSQQEKILRNSEAIMSLLRMVTSRISK